MKKFNELCEQITNTIEIPFDDYSNELKEVTSSVIPGKCLEYVNCKNNCIISEDSLSRTLNAIKDKEFAILTAYRGNFSKRENILRNRILRGKLNDKKMGVHQLVGHWQECNVPGKDYKDCEPSELTDVVERSYLVTKPEDMSSKEFEELILSLLTIDGETQDAAVIKKEDGIYLLFNNGETDKIGDDVSLGKINQAYSQHVKNSMPFVFEGVEVPVTNFGKQIFARYNLLYK